MTYENVTFSTSDGLVLKGWYIEPQNSSKPESNITVIVIHGQGSSKSFMLDHYGQELFDVGYRLLFFDSRYHGESPDAEFGLSYGINEVKDIRAAVDYAKAQPEVNGSHVILLAESMGAATTLFYTARYNDVAGIIVDSSWAMGDAMIEQLWPVVSGLPWFIFGQITVAMLESHYGFTFADISPAINATTITTPTFIVHGLADISISYDDADLIYDALPSSLLKEIWTYPGRGHVESYLEPNYFINIANFITTIFA